MQYAVSYVLVYKLFTQYVITYCYFKIYHICLLIYMHLQYTAVDDVVMLNSFRRLPTVYTNICLE